MRRYRRTAGRRTSGLSSRSPIWSNAGMTSRAGEQAASEGFGHA